MKDINLIYDALVNSMDDGVLMLDVHGVIQLCNPAILNLSGFDEAALVGGPFSRLYPDLDNASRFAGRLAATLHDGPSRYEGWHARRDGSRYWGESRLTALRDAAGNPLGFSCMVRDMSDSVNAEIASRENESLYRLLVEQVRDYGIFMLDDQGRIATWNEGARRIKGYEAEEIIGQYFAIFYPEEDVVSQKPAWELEVAIAEGKYEEEGWRLRKDGSRFWANIVITAVYNAEKKLVGFAKVTRDLTERKRNEQELKQSYESARQLAQELRSANRELSFANQELEQFTSIVSHDLQEPVRTVKSFLKLLEDKVAKRQFEGLDPYVDKSVRAADRMRDLIANLLHYSQIGKRDLLKEEIAVQELIDNVVQTLKAAIQSSGARITIDNQVDVVQGDRIQLAQLLQNLVSNAIKFNDHTVPEITIRCVVENTRTLFSVTDNGIGIPADALEKIFDVFRRLHTSSEYPGTGIGLAICKRIVERHRGKIWTESEPGRGTTFFFTIPNNSH